MRADPKGPAEDLRALLDATLRSCARGGPLIERLAASWSEESDENEKLLGDIQKTLKIAELAQKILVMMRKDDGPGSCDGSCQTFAAAILEAQEAAKLDPDRPDGVA